jgi:hypothetical protein
VWNAPIVFELPLSTPPFEPAGRQGKEVQERYLKVPYSILNMPQIGLAEKLLLAHIHSFGVRGCWEANTTLADMFFVTPRTITSWIGNLKKAGCILWLHPKGRYRTIWSRLHSEVRAATTLPYMGRSIPKAAVMGGQGKAALLGRNLPGSGEGGFQAIAKNDVVEVGSGLLPTKNTMSRDTTSRIIATPSPLPAGGQAPALLEDRKATAIAKIEGLGQSLGSGVRKEAVKLTPDEFARRQREQVDRLRASEAMRASIANVI